jgi:hypothetical protein
VEAFGFVNGSRMPIFMSRQLFPILEEQISGSHKKSYNCIYLAFTFLEIESIAIEIRILERSLSKAFMTFSEIDASR